MNTIQPITPISTLPIKPEITPEQEANAKNIVQDKKEELYTESKPSLTDGQTLALKADSVNKQIDAYKAGSNSETDISVKVNKDYQESVKAVDNYQDLKNISEKTNAISEYRKNSLLG